ncbi:GntR family transcriptional regulator/MocR family aminotransferase [Cytobacillus firmus]|uniref:GntR family transcriptional regulator/MocR family aminotransferase n=2 Tax=Cytobacillus TaxID=2675230 RepID=A0A366JF44_CYTFI|nr:MULTISPECIES: PLP-dependent aminotransferase family protein [Cytobacillus]RBP85397.1 GntR family transcriptional regulator/MocR family aminotransferase [Cytobacillus firmus]TDX35480.1 GntR family transcriptional regulator/MocR family aminotransferase [Cytobacillus oceanisediminis]
MLEILIKDEKNTPIYLTLYRHIREAIRNGEIPDGMRLPSIRSLQMQLNISKTPIETAFQMLTAEGYVISKPRSGFYAINPQVALPTKKYELYADQEIKGINYPHVESKPTIDFNPSAVDPHCFPIRTWNKMLKEALENFSMDIGKYGDLQGEFKLRAALADYLFKARGVHCTPEQIIIGSGIADSIQIICHLFNDNSWIAFEEPGYNLVRKQFVMNGFEVLPIQVGEKGISVNDVEGRSAKLAYITPSHQFPTGCIMPFSEREHFLKWAINKDAFIIEDDYDGEFRYIGKPIPSLQSLDRYDRVIYIGTFSKVFTPALRMNYLVLPQKLMKRLKENSYEFTSAPSRITQWAMISFIEHGHWYRHIRRVRKLYRKKHHKLIELIQKNFHNHIKITGQNAGLHIQITVNTKESTETLIKSAAEEGIIVYDFKNMWMTIRTEPLPRLYLGFAGVSEKDMEIGIELLKKAWLPYLQ